MKANIYIDGFNLYDGALKNTPYRWLSIAAMCHLLVDGYQDDYEIAIIVSKDSDLLAPIQVVTGQLKKPVGLLNPQKHPSRALLPHVLFIKQIRSGMLARSQFPITLTDARGSFSKPVSW